MLMVKCQNYVWFDRNQWHLQNVTPLKILPTPIIRQNSKTAWSPINVIKCNMQNSFKVIGGLDDEPYCRLNSETEIE